MGRPRKAGNGIYPSGIYPSKGWLFWREPASGDWVKVCRVTEWDTKAARDKWVELSAGKAKGGTVAHLLDAFLKVRLQMVRENKLAARTYDDNVEYSRFLKMAFGTMAYQNVNGRHIAAYLERRTWQPKPVQDANGVPVTPPPRRAPVRANKEVSLLSSAYSWAMTSPDYPLATSNPCVGIARNPEKRKERCPEVWEIEAVKAKASPMWSYIFDLAYMGGKRGVEIRMLPKAAVQVDGLHVKSAKGKSGEPAREVIIEWSPELYATILGIWAYSDEIAAHTQTSSAYLILARGGGPYTPHGWKTTMYKLVRAAMADAENPLKEAFSFHDFRSRSATDEEELYGTSPQDRLGHVRRATTDIYMRGKRPKKVKALPLKQASNG